MTGAATCWSRYGGVAQPPPGAYETGHCYQGAVCCGVAQGGSLSCWNAESGSSAVFSIETGIPTGSFADVAVLSDSSACAVSMSGSIECWGSATSFQTNRPLGGGFQRIGETGGQFCAAGTLGGACWGSGGTDGTLVVPAGDYVQVVENTGLLVTGEVVVFDSSGLSRPGELFSVIARGDPGLGVTTDGRIAPTDGKGSYWPGR